MEIERFFAGEIKDLVPLHISKNFHEAIALIDAKRLYGIMKWKHVALPECC
jgi:hypothetical protein